VSRHCPREALAALARSTASQIAPHGPGNHAHPFARPDSRPRGRTRQRTQAPARADAGVVRAAPGQRRVLQPQARNLVCSLAERRGSRGAPARQRDHSRAFESEATQPDWGWYTAALEPPIVRGFSLVFRDASHLRARLVAASRDGCGRHCVPTSVLPRAGLALWGGKLDPRRGSVSQRCDFRAELSLRTARRRRRDRLGGLIHKYSLAARNRIRAPHTL
jgi:hypothetical protein